MTSPTPFSYVKKQVCHNSNDRFIQALAVADFGCSDQIDKHTLEIAQADNVTYTNMQELADELPGHSPRYVLLSYPLTLVRAVLLCSS